MIEIKQCFVVGPMRTKEDREKMKKLARDILEPAFRLQKGDHFEVITPLTLQGGDIASNVIREIDRAEIMVVNLTGNNPNVFYELAICHALGVPCIVVQEEDNAPSFYAARNLSLTIDFDSPSDSVLVLADHIGNILRGKNPETYLESPIRHFFTRSIVDISPAIGVAQGYYYNLIRHARETLGRINNGVWQHDLKIWEKITFIDVPPDQRAGIKYRVIIPTQLKYTTQNMVNKVNNYKDCIKGQMILKHYTEEGGIVESRPYGITFHRISENQYEIVDVPTSMNPMIESLNLRMRIKTGKQIDSNDPDWRFHEGEEINRFQDELKELLRVYASLEEMHSPAPTFRNKIEVISFNPDDNEEIRKNNFGWLWNAFHS